MTDQPTPSLRKPKPQTVLEVIERIQLTPHMVRLVLGGPGFSDFQANERTDQYVKLVFAKPELNLPMPFDMAELRQTLPPEDVPVTRTYTVRSIDRAAQTLSIDFVTHGTEGLAAPWAATAEPGQQLLLLGPGGGYSPDPTADWHLFAGDASALPAIAASVEALQENAKGLAFIVLNHQEDVQELDGPAGLEVRYTVMEGIDSDPTRLSAAMAEVEWPSGTVDVFAHGERESIKEVRRLLKERGVPRENISISGYWAYGRTEDRFQAEKREPIGKIED